MNRPRFCFFVTAMVCMLSSPVAFSQVATGTPAFGSFGGGPFDTINLSNLNVHFTIPIMNKAGRVLPFNYALTYDNSIWSPNSTWLSVNGWGWNSIGDGVTGYLKEYTNTTQCYYNNHYYWITYNDFGPYYDAQGMMHNVSVQTTLGQSSCNIAPVSGGTSYASDGSGYTLVVTNTTNAAIKSLGGVTINPFIMQGGSFTTPQQGSVVDPNGNTIGFSYNSPTTTYTDTLNTTALTVNAPAPPTATTLSYTNPQGNTNTPFTIQYTNQIIETNFGCSGVGEIGRTILTNQYLVSEIDLPDTTKYTFSYELTLNPVHTGAVTGRLASVTLPTGGKISYTYTGGNSGIICTDGSTATLTRTVYPDGVTPQVWTYAHSENGTAWTTTITDPQSNGATYNFQQVSGTQLAYETERVINQGTSTLLATVDTCYNGASIPCTGTAITYPLSSRTVRTTNQSGSFKTSTAYNSYSLPTETDEYDYGGSTPVRKTYTQYFNFNHPFPYIEDRPSSINVCTSVGGDSACGGTGSVAASVSYGYDANGNVLTESHYNAGGSPTSISRSFTYKTNGTLSTATDYNSSTHLTSYTYGTGSCNNAFPISITMPMSLSITSINWNCAGGVMTSFNDANGQPTTYTYNDSNHFWRPTGVTYADGGSTTTTYTDTANAFSVATSRLVSSALGNHTVTQYLDGLGRVIKSQDNTASSSVETTYDSLGHVYSVSNPHTSTGEPSDGTTYYSYDALGRPSDEATTHAITYPDTSFTSITYLGRCATTTDPASKTRTLCWDGLGRMFTAVEDPSGLNYQTTYTHDDLDNLTGVNQGGQTRTYNYDMLSRLTSATTPEVSLPNGTQCSTTYGYDANGNMISKKAPLPNQNTYCTDATHYVTTTYAYDALNRLSSRSYNDTPRTPPASFFYDQAPSSMPAWSGVSFSNAKGRLVLACTNTTLGTCTSPATATAYNYDPVGRTADFWQCTPANCNTSSIWDTHYNYDLAGDVTSWAHPGQFTLTNTVNAAQQVTAVQSSLTSSSMPGILAQNIAYTPWGAVTSLQNGCVPAGSCTNAQETYDYNNRLQPVRIQLGTATNQSADYCLVYNYYGGSNPSSCTVPTPGSTGNNGNVMGYWYQDGPLSTASHKLSYSYDSLNRLGTAVATDLSNNVLWSQTYTYDRLGNMSCSGTGLCTSMSYNASNNNQLSSVGLASVTYDAAGNLTQDSSSVPPHSYQWDAEGHIISIDGGSTASMTFNALGWRVYRTNGTRSYWVDPQGRFLGGYWGQWNAAIPFGGRTLAEDTNGTTGPLYFDHPNALGSEEQWTNWAGSYAGEVQFYPWGAKWGDTTNGNVFQYFASLQWYDPEVDGYQPPNRYEIPRLGRWLTPDPLGGDITNPQSLNRYPYVLNNPTSLTDPLGLGVCPPGTAWTSCNPEEAAQSNLGGLMGSLYQGYGIAGPNEFDILEGLNGWRLEYEGTINIPQPAGPEGEIPWFSTAWDVWFAFSEAPVSLDLRGLPNTGALQQMAGRARAASWYGWARSPRK